MIFADDTLFNQGCSSDIAVHFYSLSSELNPDWSQSHVYHDELQAYWSSLARKHGLFPNITFDTKVVAANWDIAKQVWHVVVENVLTGARTISDAQIVISAIGILEIPRYPDIPGLSSFKGDMFHSARWKKDVDLRGKRVAVIGNGASAYVSCTQVTSLDIDVFFSM